MPSTKSQTFMAAATLAVLAGSMLGSVSAAPLSRDQQLFGEGIDAMGQHTNNIHKAEDVHIPEGLRDAAATGMATQPHAPRLVPRFQNPWLDSGTAQARTVAANALTQTAITHNQAVLAHVMGPNAHDHTRGAALHAQAAQSNTDAGHAHTAAAQGHDQAASAHGAGTQHDIHINRAAQHRDVADNHHTAAQEHDSQAHALRQLAARSSLLDGLEKLD